MQVSRRDARDDDASWSVNNLFWVVLQWLNMRWHKLRVLDGGFGSELEALGFDTNNPLWSGAALIDRPEIVVQVHTRFLAAGCDVLLTNTYHANIATMKRTRHMSDADAILVIAKAVALARQAVLERPLSNHVELVGSVGSYATALSDCSEYNGHYVDQLPRQVLVEHHVAQAKALLGAGLSMLAFETVPAHQEASAILEALQLLPEDVRCWISFACCDGTRTNHKDDFAAAVSEITQHPKVIAAGINCTAPVYISSLLHSAAHCSHGKPFVVYPNSGELYDVPTASWKDDGTRRSLSTYIAEWEALGVRLIGGCCRVDCSQIAAIAREIHHR